MSTVATSSEFIIGLESEGLEEIPTRSGTVALDAALDGAGGKSLKCTVTSVLNSYASLTGFGANGDHQVLSCVQFGCSFAFKQDVLPSSVLIPREIFRVETSPGTRGAAIAIDSTGAVFLMDAGGSVLFPYGTYVAGSVMRVAFHIYGSLVVSLRLNGGIVASKIISGNGPFVRAYVGNKGTLDTTSYNLWYDSIVGWDGPMPPDCDVVMLTPSADGYYHEWPAGNYTAVDERPHDSNTTYIGADAVNERDTQAMPNDSPLVQTYTWAVGAWAVVRHALGLVNYIAMRLRSGSTDADTGGANTSWAYKGYGCVHFVAPATSLPWTLDTLNGVEVGCVATIMGFPGVDAIRATQIGLMVATWGGPDPRPFVGAFTAPAALPAPLDEPPTPPASAGEDLLPTWDAAEFAGAFGMPVMIGLPTEEQAIPSPFAGEALLPPWDAAEFAGSFDLPAMLSVSPEELDYVAAWIGEGLWVAAPEAEPEPPGPAPEMEPQTGGVIRASAFLHASGMRRYATAERVNPAGKAAIVTPFLADDGERLGQRLLSTGKRTLFSPYLSAASVRVWRGDAQAIACGGYRFPEYILQDVGQSVQTQSQRTFGRVSGPAQFKLKAAGCNVVGAIVRQFYGYFFVPWNSIVSVSSIILQLDVRKFRVFAAYPGTDMSPFPQNFSLTGTTGEIDIPQEWLDSRLVSFSGISGGQGIVVWGSAVVNCNFAWSLSDSSGPENRVLSHSIYQWELV